jgi:hypothetical protein
VEGPAVRLRRGYGGPKRRDPALAGWEWSKGALAISLMGAGVHHPVALAAVLVYRVISFWLVISVGWLVYFFSSRTGREASWGVRTTP